MIDSKRVETHEIGERERPDGMIASELHAFIDIGGARDAFLQREDRLVEHRTQHAVDGEARRVLDVDRCFADHTDEFGGGSAASARSSSSPRISSTSAIRGTGLKKCMPMKRSGRAVAAASAVIEIDEVLVARTASRRDDLVGLTS
jgi:hypothetical protein